MRCNERNTDGSRSSRDGDWHEVWAQLGGTTLSVWDMLKIEDARRRGSQAPPTYVNVTDAFMQVTGPVHIPPIGNSPARICNDAFTLNTAGLNLISFGCGDRVSLNSWIAALRLALWERARIEEIYTAHLLRMSLCDSHGVWKEPQLALVKGKMEGWTKVRVAGQTDWKRVWVVISMGSGSSDNENRRSSSPINVRRSRFSTLFGNGGSVPADSTKQQASIAIYSSNKLKDRKAPLLTITDVTYAFAVYPERVDLISMSTLIKIEGMIGPQDAANTMKNREGWLLIMPEFESDTPPPLEMLKWLVALHDAFGLHGRPHGYSWDPLNPISPMFAYPIGDRRDDLFLLREEAETVNPMIDRMTVVRESFTQIVRQKVMRLHGPHRTLSTPSPPTAALAPVTQIPMQLPPLEFDTPQLPAVSSPSFSQQILRTPLAPIEENIRTNSNIPPTETMVKPGNLEANLDVVRDPGSNTNPVLSPTSKNEESGLEHIITLLDKSSPPQSPKHDSSQRLSDESYFNVEPPRLESHIVDSDQYSEKRLDRTTIIHSPRTSESYSNVSARTFPTPVVAAVPSPVIPTAQLPQSEITSHPQSPPRQSPSTLHSDTRTPSSPAMPGRPALTTQSSRHSFHQTQTVEKYSPQSGAQRTDSPLGFHSPTFLPNGSPADLVQGSPRSVGVQLRSPGSPSPSLTRLPPRSPPQSTPSPMRTTRILSPSAEAQAANQLPARSHLSDDSHSTSRRQSDRRDHFTVGNSRPQSVPRNLPAPPEQPRTPIEYTITPTPEGPSIVERLRRQIAEEEGYMDEAGAQYIAQKLLEGSSIDHSDLEDDEKPITPGTSSSVSVPLTNSTPVALPPSYLQTGSLKSLPPNTDSVSIAADSTADPALTVRALKPSGARPVPRRSSNPSSNRRPMTSQVYPADDESNDLGADAFAALTFVEKEDTRSEAPLAKDARSEQPGPGDGPHASHIRLVANFGQSDATESSPYPSSFAASKQAAERKAKAQASIAASQAAAHKPGRSSLPSKGGKAPTKGAWESSEEEEEDEEEDDDDGSDAEPARGPTDAPGPAIRSQPHTLYAPQAQQPNHITGAGGMHEFGVRVSSYGDDQPRSRARNLPSIPRTGSATNDQQNSTLRPRNSPHPDESRPRTYHEDEHRSVPPRLRADTPVRPSSTERHPPRNNFWSSVLDTDKAGNAGPPVSSNRDTFVTLEPSETMTKAFAPQGLLQVGLQDKQDRSAKRIEEIAREHGDSYVHVPNKPPPPQSGLLGAITAHERERKREGGVGAALTERERERRLAEERQRKIDELQRQQLEYAQQQGMSPEVLGQFGNPMMNPMMMGNPMMNPMMMGMMGNPMMGGGLSPSFTGYPPAWGMPQMPQMQMMAQQAAAEAYRNAMMAFSQAGSVTGTAPDRGGPMAAMHSTSPAMWGGMNTMSMYGIPPQMTGQSWGGFGSPMPDFSNMNGLNTSPGLSQGMGDRTSMFGGLAQQQSPDPNHLLPSSANSTSRTDTPPATKPS
ncbi:uncharacterized protein EI90DRAFT_2253521 [Cantharellus anzutake]|uniref:uncharacterized protein n=1 Tax=Cantharellus anzutake TaxID=1750568 RepID=UPI001903CDE8|nr:uncharacterized protein EI90DRAFT_2253521 [Cantharellus anzutake]KAF8339564.1 hypothetical protein EI90DRAFT_2253521 [Cantharellus anzutake]